MALNLSTKENFYTKYGNAIKLNQPNNMTLIPQTELPQNMSINSPITSVNIEPRLFNIVHPESLPMTKISDVKSAPNIGVSYENMKQFTAPVEARLSQIGEMQAKQNEYLQKAQEQQSRANQFRMVSAGLQALDSYTNFKSVLKSKTQYETQKKVLDTNLANTETALETQLRENIADLDTISAAKNVDLSSQALTSSKEKAMEDISRDISQLRTQNNLQKAALDLQYKMNKYQARSNMVSSAINAGVTIASLI